LGYEYFRKAFASIVWLFLKFVRYKRKDTNIMIIEILDGISLFCLNLIAKLGNFQFSEFK
jgi:hypothetical protein